MMNFLNKLFGTPKTDLGPVIACGAVIVDVRTPGEFASGHIQGAVNIPLDQLEKRITELNKEIPVITCCLSGMRSEAAKRTLKANGFSEVYNGGNWAELKIYENIPAIR